MIAFLDTEFTSLMRPQLLSIGLVTLDGREFYAEIDLDTVVGRELEMASSDFVRFEGVLDQFRRVPGAACSRSEIGMRLCGWLLSLPQADSILPMQIAFDSDIDFDLMASALRDSDCWHHVRDLLSPINVYRLTESFIGRTAADFWCRLGTGNGLTRHHALADARVLRAAYLTAKKEKSELREQTDPMTTPEERLRALRWGAEMLRQIAFDMTIPEAMIGRANLIAKRYPAPEAIDEHVHVGDAGIPPEWASAFVEAGDLFRELQSACEGSEKTKLDLRYTGRHYPHPNLVKAMTLKFLPSPWLPGPRTNDHGR